MLILRKGIKKSQSTFCRQMFETHWLFDNTMLKYGKLKDAKYTGLGCNIVCHEYII